MCLLVAVAVVQTAPSQDEADVDWHQPQITHLPSSSDLLRGVRQVEEPLLTLALWKETPQNLRWTLSEAALEVLVLTSQGEEREWAQQQLDRRRRGPTTAASALAAMGKGRGRAGGKGAPSRGKGAGPSFFQDTWARAAR